MSAVVAPALPDAPVLPTFTPGMSTILSIWPFDQLFTTYHAGVITYGHPAAEKNRFKHVQMNPDRVSPAGRGCHPDVWMAKYGDEECAPGKGYVRIDVFDTYTSQRNFTAETDQSPVVLQQNPISAVAVADMLVKVFSGGRHGDNIYGGPGVAVYDPKRSIESQLADLDQRQRLFAETMINQAEEFAQAREFKNISAVHRKLAQWIGYVGKDWGAASMRVLKTKACPNCQQDIPSAALKCTASGCGINLVEFFNEYGIGKDDQAVQEIISMRDRLKKQAEAEKKKA